MSEGQCPLRSSKATGANSIGTQSVKARYELTETDKFTNFIEDTNLLFTKKYFPNTKLFTYLPLNIYDD